MTTKHLLFRGDARERILRGATALADAVRVTLGPKSKSVLIDRKYGRPVVCNDGVTIARELDLEDPEENLGAHMLREAAERTGELVGDGTSTSTIIAHAIFADGLRSLAAGMSGIDIKRGLDRGVAAAVAAIRAQARPVAALREKVQVATISAHNDKAIGELVADAMERVGREGAVSVEEAKGTQTTLDVVEGMQLDRGFLSAYFVTDAARLEAVLEEPFILLREDKIGTLRELLPILEQVAEQRRALLVVADDVEAEALATLVVNRLRGLLSCAAIRAPGYGDRRKALMEDLAVVTGGRFLSAELGVRPESIALADLGKARRVVVGKETTIIVGGGGDAQAIAARCQELRAALQKETSDYEREHLQKRLARLAAGVAVIRVGAPSETEMKSRKEAFEDAISATQAAIDEGIVPGGGVVLLKAVGAVLAEEPRCDNEEERTGLRVLARALEAPIRQIAENSGIDGAVVVGKLKDAPGALGFDAARGRFVDLFEAGIVDATKVVRVAVENAVSVASVLLLTEATMTEVRERQPAEAAREVELPY